jgi:hypothetical protein
MVIVIKLKILIIHNMIKKLFNNLFLFLMQQFNFIGG